MVQKSATKKSNKKTTKKTTRSIVHDNSENVILDSEFTIKDMLLDGGKRELSDDDLSNVNGGLDITTLIQMLINLGVDKFKNE